jgi:Mrp family chromosome partitioning ATPase
VISQLSVLESASLVNEVALANGLSITAVRQAVTVEQDPDTDVVEISAVTADPDQARSIAQSYVEAYMSTLDTDRSDTGELQRLEEEINNLRTQLTNLNDAIQEAMDPYLELLDNRTPPPLPPPDSVEPTLVTERNIIQAEVSQLIAQRNQLVSDSRLRVNTRVIQQATLPTEPVPAGGQFVLAGGLFAGAMLGVLAAMAWARFSTKVLDADTASEILGAPVVSELPHYRSLARQPLAAFQALPRTAIPVIDQLCVRAEAKARINEPLTVAVVGAQRNAGTTTLALAMAERFAGGGSSVVVIDADVRDPRITAIFNASQDGGVPAVVLNDGALIDQRGRSVFTRTMDPEVSVLGLGSSRGAASLRRDTVASVLEAARRKAQIVVVDGGPALDLASTLQLTAMADAVVLAVPLARQKSDTLSDLSRQLDNVRDKLLPVVTSPARRPAKGEIVGVDGAIGGPTGVDWAPPQSPVDLTSAGNGSRSRPEADATVVGGSVPSRSGGGTPAPPSGPV